MIEISVALITILKKVLNELYQYLKGLCMKPKS